MKMKKLVLLLVYACWFVGGICFFSSCQRQLDANAKIVKVSVDQADEEYLASSFIRNYKIIPLETNENCLLSSIDKIKKVNEKLFVLDRVNNAIFIFRESGEYLQSLFKVGNGPGEYVQIMDFDVEDDCLYVLDFPRQAILKYNEDLSYEGMVQYSTMASQFLISGEKIFLYNEPSGQKDDYRFSLLDKNGNYIENILPREGLATYNYGGIDVFSKVNNIPFISPIYGNMIYSGDQFDQACQICFSERTFPDGENIEEYDISSPDFTYLLKEHFFVTDHHFIFSYGYDGNRCYAVYDREDDKMIAQGKIKNDLIENFRFFHRWGNGNLLIEEINPDLLYQYFPSLLNRKELLELKEEDNPVVILYETK